MSIGTLQDLSSLSDSFCEHLEDCFGIFPADACISDTDAVFQSGLTLLRYFLVACKWSAMVQGRTLSILTFIDIALDHYTHDCLLSFRNLLCQHSSNLGLILVVLQ
jgi:hypothetical protein